MVLIFLTLLKIVRQYYFLYKAKAENVIKMFQEFQYLKKYFSLKKSILRAIRLFFRQNYNEFSTLVNYRELFYI